MTYSIADWPPFPKKLVNRFNKLREVDWRVIDPEGRNKQRWISLKGGFKNRRGKSFICFDRLRNEVQYFENLLNKRSEFECNEQKCEQREQDGAE